MTQSSPSSYPTFERHVGNETLTAYVLLVRVTFGIKSGFHTWAVLGGIVCPSVSSSVRPMATNAKSGNVVQLCSIRNVQVRGSRAQSSKGAGELKVVVRRLCLSESWEARGLRFGPTTKIVLSLSSRGSHKAYLKLEARARKICNTQSLSRRHSTHISCPKVQITRRKTALVRCDDSFWHQASQISAYGV